MEKMKKHFLRRMALVMALLTLGSAVLVGCGEQKEPEPDPKDEVIVEPEFFLNCLLSVFSFVSF